MPVPGFASRITRLPLLAGRAAGGLARKLLRLMLLAGAATALVLVLDVLLLGKREDGKER